MKIRTMAAVFAAKSAGFICRKMGRQGVTWAGKIALKINPDILEDLSLDLADTKDALVDLTDGVEEINEDLAELENEFYESPCSCCGGDDEDEEYEDEDEDDTVFYSVECPGCGFKLTVDEDTLNAGSFECPECGEVIDFENAAVEEVVFDDEDDEDEKD